MPHDLIIGSINNGLVRSKPNSLESVTVFQSKIQLRSTYLKMSHSPPSLGVIVLCHVPSFSVQQVSTRYDSIVTTFISLLFSLILNKTSDMWSKGNPMVIKKKKLSTQMFFTLSLSLFNSSTPPSSAVKLEKSLTHVSMLPSLRWFSIDLIT